jgi:NAD(P)-dependent dehydrogenase (short-subunit alcohol dehydrogenase family)
MLDGKAVIVTGAAQGLGRAFAVGAAQAGARVLVADIDASGAQETAALIAAAGGEASPFIGSVADWEAAAAMVATCQERFGSLDGLVNDAALFVTGPAEAETPERIRALVEVNVHGVLFSGVHALRAMRAQGRGGSIVNLTSAARAGRRQMSVYAATKGAVASVTYAWALEGAEFGVRVNALAPRALTNMTLMGTDSPPDHAPPEHVAPLVTYLLSDQAHAVNGQIIHFDGRGLAIAAAPGLAAAAVRPEPWSVADVGDVLAGELRAAAQPIGWTGGAVSGRPAVS